MRSCEYEGPFFGMHRIYLPGTSTYVEPADSIRSSTDVGGMCVVVLQLTIQSDETDHVAVALSPFVSGWEGDRHLFRKGTAALMV